MRFLSLFCALALSAPTVGAQVPPAAQKAAPPRQHLSDEEWKWIDTTYEKALVFGRKGKWGHDEAQGPVREILARSIRDFGEDHYVSRYYRQEIEWLKKLAAFPEADRVEYMKTYTLCEAMNELWKEKRYADALKPAEELRDIYRRLLGPDVVYAALATNWCGQLLYLADQYAEAEKQLREALRIYCVVGIDHRSWADAHRYLANTLERLGQPAKAREQYEAVLAAYGLFYGDDHPWTAVAGNNLAGNLERLAYYEDAEKLHHKAIAIFKAWGDDCNSMLATTYSNLALNLNNQGRYGEAEERFQDAFTILRQLKIDDQPERWQLYLNFASNKEAQGNIAAAEPLYVRALDYARKAHGEKSLEAAWAMNSLAVNLDNQGKFSLAEPELRGALAIAQGLPGDQTRLLSRLYNNLGSCLRGQEKLEAALELCEKALALARSGSDPIHPDVSAALNNIAAPLSDLHRYEEADKHFRDALAIVERRLGKDHPDTSLSRVNLAVNLYHLGRYDEAEPYLRDALDSMQRVLGEAHPRTAWAYKCLVGNACARGDYERAESLAAAATASFEAARLRLGFAGLDRASRATDISPMPGLAVAGVRRNKPGNAWQAMERDLARGLLDDIMVSRLSDSNRRHVKDLIEKLASLDQRVSALRARGPVADKDREAAEKDRDTAQAALVRILTDPAARHDGVAGQVYDLARIQKQLSADEALVAWVELPAGRDWKDAKGDHWGCVVRSQGAPIWVQLPGTGDNGAWTDEDNRRGLRTARFFARRPRDMTGQWQELADQLARQRLEPLEKPLQARDGLPGVRHLIVLPCEKMAAVPVEALTKKYTVSYAPSGTMYAWLKEQRTGHPAPAASLLALGDPAFLPPRDNGPAAQAGAPRPGGRREVFAPLPGTNAELLGIARVFPTKRLLTGSEASERNLDELTAAGRLREYRYLHFATHGVLDDQRPMQSALVLARNPSPTENNGDDRNGRLTAEQILRGWKLDADLVTLSACDTGLGQLSGGEGYLGFSQALFLAGARSSMLSLWQVDDAATSLLMTRFYENLLGTPEGTVKPMAKAEALAEAKRWLRSLGPDEVRELTKDLPTRGTRGRVEPRSGAGDAKAVRTYDHPYFWSGFILMGDPR